MLSKTPEPIALKQKPSTEEPKEDFKRKWKHCINEKMIRTRERLEKAHNRYKKNYDARLRKQTEVIHEDDYMYLSLQQKKRTDNRHKLALVAEGRYKVTKVDKNTVLIKKTYLSVEKLTRSRVVLAPTAG